MNFSERLELHQNFQSSRKFTDNHQHKQQCHSEEHHAAAAQAQILEEDRVEEVVDLVAVEVRNSNYHIRQAGTDISTGRGGFGQRDNGPPDAVLGKNCIHGPQNQLLTASLRNW